MSQVSSNDLDINDISPKDEEEFEEEDIPGDFFDDFLKDDFMAGLDIVDEDGEEVKEKNFMSPEQPRRPLKKTSAQREIIRKRTMKIDHVKKFRESPPGVRKRMSSRNELRRLNAEIEEIKRTKIHIPTKSKSSIDADDFDIRRDPEKTRRDIQMDKIKSAKDKEKRLITDIVETGLVPPGMELEVDIETVRRQERIEKNMPPGDLRERLRSRRSRSLDKKKSVSPERRKYSPTVAKRRKSPLGMEFKSETSKYPKKLSSSPKRRRESFASEDRDKYHSEERVRRSKMSSENRQQRSPRRSPMLRRSPYRRSPGSRRSPLYRRSPLIRRSRTRSPYFNQSPTYRRRRRDHSYSPKQRRHRSRTRSPRKLRREEQRSFLEELAEKLNEPRPNPIVAPQMSYNMTPLTAPVPVPVPAPNQFFPSLPLQSHLPATQQYDPYDQSFFIGSQPSPVPLNNTPQNPISISEQVDKVATPASNPDVSKLFEDKKIRLSDFLAITAKPQVNTSTPAKLQEKIKVIQRCQDVIKILSSNRKFAGPLVIRKTENYQPLKDKNISPLLRKPIVQLPFTTPGLKKSNENEFTKFCQMLLHRVGIDKLPNLGEEEPKPKVPLETVPIEHIAQVPPSPVIAPQPYSQTVSMVENHTSATQTDPELSACKECLRRRDIDHESIAVQCGAPMLTFSVSTQVNEGDFYSTIPKTQSLASLTPAQLLGRQMRNLDSGLNFQPRSFDPPSRDADFSRSVSGLRSKANDYATRVNDNESLEYSSRDVDKGYNLMSKNSPSKSFDFQPRNIGSSKTTFSNQFDFQASKRFRNDRNDSMVPNNSMSLSATLRASLNSGKGAPYHSLNKKF